MIKRVGLLGLLLALALGSGVVAQSPSPPPLPSPMATPLFAPDDLASVVPSSVGGVALTVMGDRGEGGQGFLWGPDIERDFLTPLGRVPEDVRQAVGLTDPVAPEVAVIALRVDGIDGEVMLDALIDAMMVRPEVATAPPDITFEWLDIDGRRVRLIATEGGPPTYLYAKGEVGFVIALAEDGTLTVEEVVAELP